MIRMTAIWLMLLSAPAALAQDMPLSQVLVEGEGWEVVSSGHQFTEGPAADARGNVYFTDVRGSRIHRVGVDGTVSLFAEDTQRTNGLMFGADGRLYGCRGGDRSIVAYGEDGSAEIIVHGVDCNDLAVTGSGAIYFTDPPGRRVWYVDPDGVKRVVAEGFRPNGVILWTDEGTLVATDSERPVLWTFRVEPDGSLTAKAPYYGPLQLATGADRPGSDGMTVDDDGRLYVATRAGLQVFDPTGRPCGAIAKPQDGPLSNVVFGGPEFSLLYVTCGDKVYRRRTNVSGTPLAARAAAESDRAE